MAKCPLCRNESGTFHDQEVELRDFCSFSCKTCGSFSISKEACEDLGRTFQEEGYKVSALSRQRAIARQAFPRFVTSLDAIRIKQDIGPLRLIGIDDAIATFPKTVSERLDRTLLNIAIMAAKPGATVVLHPSQDFTIASAEDVEAGAYLLEQLAAKGLLELSARTDGRGARLTVDGWNRVAEIQRPKLSSESGGVFVAMWFGEDGRPDREHGIRQAIQLAGFGEPFIADRIDFLGRIDDRIIAELRKCRFVIADMTEHRPNVYFEAGFAEGLGKPVIYTCHSGHIDRCHFDTRQQNIVVWEDSSDLAERLARRISAVIEPFER